jgi:peptidoglycan/LPS O-acetylase OafA/YrhL
MTALSTGAAAASGHEVRSAVAADIRRGFNPYLHGARGLFAFMIVVFHVVNSRLETLPLLSAGAPLMLTRSLEHGVELFFGISGIVIVGALQRARGPVVFAIERGTRIYPVLWLSILVLVALSGLTHYEGRGLPTVGVLLANLFALPPLVPGPLIHPAAWSLSYELLFYGFCAIAWALRRRVGHAALGLAALVAVALLFFHVRALLMPVGMGAALALERRPNLARLTPAPGLAFAVFLVGWEVLCQGHQGDLMAITLASLRPMEWLILAICLAAAFSAFAGVLAGRGVFSRLLATAPLQFLGTISYSLYLWHPIIMSVVKHAMYVLHLPAHLGPLSQAAFFVLVLPPSLLAGWASQATMEKHVTLWLRRKLEPGRTPARAPLTAQEPHPVASTPPAPTL